MKVDQCLNAPFGAQCFPTVKMECGRTKITSQCTFWCSVLSDACNEPLCRGRIKSQCTFWCSVLSDVRFRFARLSRDSSLNAPFGAQCFPTFVNLTPHELNIKVSMHLLVLSAFRQCDGRGRAHRANVSQCTFWCSVLSDSIFSSSLLFRGVTVSMHLLVLSAFRPQRWS